MRPELPCVDVTKTPRFIHSIPILKQLRWLPVKFRIHFKICAIAFRTLKDKQPVYWFVNKCISVIKVNQMLYFDTIQYTFVKIHIRRSQTCHQIGGIA